MADSIFNRFDRSVIICSRMCDRNHRFILNLADKFHSALSFRCDVHQLKQTVGCLLESLIHFYIRFMNISRILCAFFGLIDKRPFHIDAHEVRSAVPLVGCRSLRDGHQCFLRQSHRCRTYGKHSILCLIRSNFSYGFFCPVTKIISHTAMEVNIDQPGNRIAVLCIQNLVTV